MKNPLWQPSRVKNVFCPFDCPLQHVEETPTTTSVHFCPRVVKNAPPSLPPSLFFLTRKSIDPCVRANLLCVSRLLRPPRRVPPTRQPPICGRRESRHLILSQSWSHWSRCWTTSDGWWCCRHPLHWRSLKHCSCCWSSCLHHLRRCSRRSRSSQNRVRWPRLGRKGFCGCG